MHDHNMPQIVAAAIITSTAYTHWHNFNFKADKTAATIRSSAPGARRNQTDVHAL